MTKKKVTKKKVAKKPKTPRELRAFAKRRAEGLMRDIGDLDDVVSQKALYASSMAKLRTIIQDLDQWL